MRLPSLDFGNSRQRRRAQHSILASASNRGLATVLRRHDSRAAGAEAAPCEADSPRQVRSGTLSTRSTSSRSLASKVFGAFGAVGTRQARADTLEISAPISRNVLHPGLATSEFGTPVRNADGWEEFVRVEPIEYYDPSADEDFYVERALYPPTLPDIPTTSPMLSPSRMSVDNSSPFYVVPGSSAIPDSAASKYSTVSSPEKPSWRFAHLRHKSLPALSPLSSPRNQRKAWRAPTPPSPQETPTRPRNNSKRSAFYERASRPVIIPFDSLSASASTSPQCSMPCSPTTSSSVCSSSSSQFLIRRKPVPLLDVGEEQLSRSNYVRSRSGSIDASGWTRSHAMSGIPRPSLLVAPSTPLLQPVDLSPPSVGVTQTTPRSFRDELDTLFDELMEQCRAPLTSLLTQRTPSSSRHQRAYSLQGEATFDLALQPSHTPRKSVRSTLPLHQSLPSFKHLDDVHESDTDAEADETVIADNENADPNMPRSKSTRTHHRVSNLRPFFPSGRTFDPIRTVPALQPRVPAAPTSVPATPLGRVKSAVRRIEQSSPANTTPVSKLGALLQQQASVDSNELTLESKRMMEEARRRRAHPLK